ncbi:MAG TPA: hypothetical protein VHX38_41315 [Pseudonocardiaceae bacterium]|nr:hypothetical protein [Pseudonocardiaceae bacterium]
MAGDLVVVDVEPLEQGLVEQAALFVVAPAVELLRVVQELQTQLDQPSALGEIVVRLGEAFGQVLALMFDLVELGVDLGLGGGHCVVGHRHQVDQVVFFGVQGSEFALELPVEEPGGCLFVRDGRADVGTDLGDEIWGEPDRRVVLLDGFLDPEHVDVRRGAGAVLRVAAEEVGVLVASGVDGVLDDQPLGDAASITVAAEQRAFEVVVVDAAAFLGGRATLGDGLDAVEQFLVDQGFVPPLELFAVVAHVAEVVPVAQHERELVDRDLPGGVSGGRPAAQTPVVEFVGQIDQRVVAGGVQLEAQTDKGRSLLVYGDGADLAAARLGFADVPVTEFGLTDAATVFHFLPHLVLDVRSTGLGLVLVDGVDDRFHHRGFRVLAHVQDGGDDAGTDLLQVTLDHAGIDGITEHPVEVVDDDVVDVLLVLDPGDHLLELGSLVNAGGRLTRLDELVDNVRVQ